jgi:hypothetical protein
MLARGLPRECWGEGHTYKRPNGHMRWRAQHREAPDSPYHAPNPGRVRDYRREIRLFGEYLLDGGFEFLGFRLHLGVETRS